MPNRQVWVVALSYVFVSLAALFAANTGRAQDSFPTDAELARIGLESAWHTHLQFDSARGNVSGIVLQISRESVQRIVEVRSDVGRRVFSERDLDPYGNALGRDGAKRKADEWIAKQQLLKRFTSDPVIRELVVPDSKVIVSSDRGFVQAINAETGSTIWTTSIGKAGHPTTPPGVNEKFVSVINGSQLYLLNLRNGGIVWDRRTEGSPGNGPAMSEQFIFVPCVNGVVERYSVEDPRRPADSASALGRTLVQPVVYRDIVAWPTDRGGMYVANAEAKGVRFRINTNTRISARPTFLPGGKKDGKFFPSRIFFASGDGYVYFADTDRGDILQRFSTGDSISDAPVALYDQVYIITDRNAMFCVGTEEADERWWQPQISSFLAGTEKTLYCLDTFNRITAIDSASGGRLGSVAVGEIGYQFMNADTDRIYFVSKTGVLHCLHEPDRHFATIHGGAEMKRKLPQVLPKNDNAPAPKAAPKKNDDPFGAAAAPDPFAVEEKMPKNDAPAAADDVDPFAAPPPKKPAAMPADDDPFGS